MKKIAFVIQQYGTAICGGAELHCRLIAERLSAYYEVEVLTTCSVDATDWADHYAPGKSLINQVTVRRFPVAQKRDTHAMNLLEKKIRPHLDKSNFSILKRFTGLFKKYATKEDQQEKAEWDWMLAQGPYCPQLISYLRENHQDYQRLFFFTYLYYPTIAGIDIDPARSILIPTAHDEWAIYLSLYRNLFGKPAYILFNTAAEMKLVRQLAAIPDQRCMIAGAGVQIPDLTEISDVKNKFGIQSSYILFVGRVEVNKFPPEFFQWFLNYISKSGRSLQLVLTGELFLKVPEHPAIITTGYVSELDKYHLMKNAELLLQPSLFESLSMVLLEAFSLGKPVLVQRSCVVMHEHIIQSGSGFSFSGEDELEECCNRILDDPSLAFEMGEKGKLYVNRHYQWPAIMNLYRKLIENNPENRLGNPS